MFKCNVLRVNDYESNEVYRTFEEFCELYQLLLKTFPALKLPKTPSLNKFKEVKIINKRRVYIKLLLDDINNLQPEITRVAFSSQ
jgi:hypothetical protein